MEIREALWGLQDETYRDFQCKLIPNVAKEKVIGVRVPDVRKLAKQYANTAEGKTFLQNLPHQYFDEDMLHGLLLSEMKDYRVCIEEVNRFLPYVNNWAVCDVMSPEVFGKNKKELMDEIKKWAASDCIYACRFGLEMLMRHFLNDDFLPEYLEIPARVTSEEYYVKMMVAWFFATALAKQWEATIPYIRENRLEKWVHNKTIQKARESYRISKEQKEHLKGLKR